LLEETPSRCLIESIRQESPKRKTLIEFYIEDECIETKYELASIESEKSSNVTSSESMVLCEECFCNGSIPIPLYIETSELRTAEIREDVAWPWGDVSIHSNPTSLISSELLDIREGYEIDENTTPGYCHGNVPVNVLANPVAKKKNEVLQLNISKREGVRPETTVEKKSTTNAIRISKMSLNISQSNKNQGKMHNNANWSQRLYQQALDRSSRLRAKRVMSKDDEKLSSSQKFESSTSTYQQCAFDNSSNRASAARRRSKSSFKDTCFEVSLAKKKQMSSKMPTPKVFEPLSQYPKESCKSLCQRQEPVLSKTRKPGSSRLATPKACERLYRLGKARQRNRRTPPLKVHDDIQKEKHYPSFFRRDYFLKSNVSKETSTTAASIESTYTGTCSVLVCDRIYKERYVKEECQSRTKSYRRPEGKAQGMINDCAPPAYNRLYGASKIKQVEGKRRRQQIEKTIAAKHAMPDWSDWTIPLDQAEDYYHKSISHALSHERKMVLAAYKMGLKYEPKYSYNSSTRGQYGWR